VAKDIFHDIVKESLVTDGWQITHDGYRLLTDLLKDALIVDIGAEKFISATKNTKK
jgi:XisH protein